MTTGVQRFARDAGLSFVSVLMSSLVHLILRILLARYLGPADLGLYTLAFTFYTFGLLLSAFGIGWALVKYVAQSKEDPSRTGQLLFIGIVISLLIGSVFWLGLHISAPWVANSFFDMPDLALLLRIVAFSLPFMALEKATLGFLNGLRRMGTFTLVNVAQNVLTMVLTIVLVQLGYGLTGAVAALVLPVVLLSLFSVFTVRRSVRRPAVSQCIPMSGTLLRFGAYVVLGNAMGMALYNTDRIALGYFLDDTAVGIYGVAAIVPQAIMLPAQAVQFITNPTISSLWGKGETKKIQEVVNRMVRLTAMLVIPLSFVLIFMSRDLVTFIFGQEYASATLPLQILLVGFAIGSLLTSVGTTLSSTDYVHMGFRLGALRLVASVALSVLLIPYLGMNGAAVATSSSMIAGAALNFYFIHRLVKIDIDWSWLTRFLLFAVVVSAASFGLGTVTHTYVGMLLGLTVLLLGTKKYFLNGEDGQTIAEVLSFGKGILRLPSS